MAIKVYGNRGGDKNEESDDESGCGETDIEVRHGCIADCGLPIANLPSAKFAIPNSRSEISLGFFHKAFNNINRRNAIGFGIEIRHNAMAKHR